MAEEKQRVDGELVAFELSFLPAAIWGGLPEFAKLNPYGIEEPPTKEMIELERWISRRALELS